MTQPTKVSRRAFLAGAATIALSAKSYARVLGADDRIRIGFIGVGGMGSGHVGACKDLQKQDNLEFLGVAHCWKTRADEAAAKLGTEGFQDYRRVLDIKNIDYVTIAVPEHTHSKITIDAFDAGKAVYCEKPMTHTIPQAQAVMKKQRETGRALQVGVQAMSDDSYSSAAGAIAEGVIGRVVQAQIEYVRRYDKQGPWRRGGLPLAGVILGGACSLFLATQVMAAEEPAAEEPAAEKPAADAPGVDAAAARRKLQQQLSSRKSGERLAAIAALGAYPSADVAKLVVSRGLKDRDEEVRRAAERALLAMKDDPAVCKCLLDVLNKEGRRKEGLEALAPLVRALLASNAPGAQAGAFGYLDALSANSPDALRLLQEAADQLGQRALPAEFPRLEALAATKSYEREFGLRRAAIRAATRYTTKEAVAFLIRALEKEKGELRGDLVECLEQVTGEQFGVNSAAWLKWWQEHGPTFEYPKRPAPLLVRSAPKAGRQGSYYGIPLYAKRLVFVLDTSNSMRGERIAAAKRDLINTVTGLDEDCHFGLVAFNSGVRVWQKALAPANDQSKRAAEYWIQGQELAVRTASFDALEAALQFDAEAIYFLTDGAPSGGRIDDPTEITRMIGQLNRTRRESIYSIGVGLRRPGNKHGIFLKSLATTNYGIYRSVDE